MPPRRKRTANDEPAAKGETTAIKKTVAKKSKKDPENSNKVPKETAAKKETKPSAKKSKEELKETTDKTETKPSVKKSKKESKEITAKKETKPSAKKSKEELKETTAKTETKPSVKKSQKESKEITAKKESKSSTKRSKEESKEITGKAENETSSKKWDSIDFGCTKKNAEGKTPNLKICCWNVGGLRSWVKKGCLEFLDYESPDILCIQETKCDEKKLPDEIKKLAKYKQYWCSSKKDGYAGVGLLTILKPINVIYGIENTEMDEDGRCITAEFKDYYLVCVYVPNAGRKLVTLPKRLEWNEMFKNFVNNLNSKKPVIICGDMNVSHNEIDLARPQNNKNNAGFTQAERDGMTEFLGEGYVDTFRHLYPNAEGAYTFWTYMANARSKNVGWRLDYFIVSEKIINNVCDSVIRSEVHGSDHCPITLFLNI